MVIITDQPEKVIFITNSDVTLKGKKKRGESEGIAKWENKKRLFPKQVGSNYQCHCILPP